MRKLFSKPVMTGKSAEEHIRDLYVYLDDLIETLNKERSTSYLQVLYTGSAASGTVSAPETVYLGRLFIAVIGGVPILAVRNENMICGRGGGTENEATMSLTLTGKNMTFTATAALEKLILIL